MDDVAKSGRTVLLVSHNMAAIANLCTTTVLLHRGQLVNYGPTPGIIEQYLKIAESSNESKGILEDARYLANIEVKNIRGDSANHILLGDCLSFEIVLKNTSQIAAPVVSVFICNHYGDRLIMLGSQMQANLKISGTGNILLRVTTDPINLLPGLYTVDVGIGSGFDLAEYLHGVISFTIEYADLFETGKLPSVKQGVIAQKATWDLLEV